MKILVFGIVVIHFLLAHADPSPRQERLANLVKRDLAKIDAVNVDGVCQNAHSNDTDTIAICAHLGLLNGTQTHGRRKRQAVAERPVDTICKDSSKLQGNADMNALCKRVNWYSQNSNIRPSVHVKPVVELDSRGKPKRITLKEITKQEAESSGPKWADVTSKVFEGGSKVPETMEKFSAIGETYGSTGPKTIGKLAMAGKSLAVPAVGKIATVTQKLSKTMKVANLLGKMGKALGALGAIASVCGPIGAAIGILFSFISMFIQQPDPIDQLKEEMNKQFDKLHERFDKLEQRLDALEFTVQKTAVYQMYKENQDRIHKVWFAQRQMVSNPGSLSLDEFKHVCTMENPLYALEWIHRRSLERNNAFGLHLFSTILNDTQYDRMKFAEFVEIITSDMVMASYLRESCLGVLLPNNTNVIWKGRRIASMMIADVSRTMASLETELMNGFHDWQLEKDINGFVESRYPEFWKNDKMDEDVKILNATKHYLQDKYFWLTFELDLMKDDSSRYGPYNATNHYLMDIRQRRKEYFLLVTWSEPDPLQKQEVRSCHANDMNSESDVFAKTSIDQIWQEKELKSRYFDHYHAPNSMAIVWKNRPASTRGQKGTHECKIDQGWQMVVSYHKSNDLPGTYACRNVSSDQLKAVKITRLDVCPGQAIEKEAESKLALVTANTVSKIFVRPEDAYGEIVLDHFLSAPLVDFSWIVSMFHANDMPYGGCRNYSEYGKYDYLNCTYYVSNAVPDRPVAFVVSFSTYFDPDILEEQANEATHTLAVVKKFASDFFKDKTGLDLMQKIHDLLTDPFKFFMTNSISEEKFMQEFTNEDIIKFLELKNKTVPTSFEELHELFNFYDNKIVTVSKNKAIYYHDSRTASMQIDGLWVYITYYTPYRVQNTKHCMMEQTEFDKQYNTEKFDSYFNKNGYRNRTTLFGCED